MATPSYYEEVSSFNQVGGYASDLTRLTHTHQVRKKSGTSPSRMELPHRHPSKEVPPSAMVLPGSGGHQCRHSLPRAHPEDQSRPVSFSAILKRRTLCLSELARAYPIPKERRVAAPKHCLLHRLKRLWRFIGNGRVDALAVQLAFVPHVLARFWATPASRGVGHRLDHVRHHLALRREDALPALEDRRSSQRGRALPLLQLAYDRDKLPAAKSQNQLEQDALLAVVRARYQPVCVR